MTKEQQTLTVNGQLLNKQNRKRYSVMTALNNRFTTYGYEPVDIPTYESYDLYTSIRGTVHRHDMVKTIDPSGEILVLRPDVTIPLMKQVAKQHYNHPINSRYYYTLKVYRHSFGEGKHKERTQSGVELLGDDSIEADAELIALAIHSLRDLSIVDFKIELGHAQFLNRLLEQLKLTNEQNKRLKQLIHSKNLIELTPFLDKYVLDSSLKRAIEQIPLMYGEPDEVFQRAKEFILTDAMTCDLQYLQDLYQMLKDYGVSEHIVIDLGLVNHMDYYSGIIFQGFVQTVGKPVLMGGRYDELAKQFQANLPAIGFAIDLETLLLGLPTDNIKDNINDIGITYIKTRRKEAFSFASLLRDSNYKVIVNSQRNEPCRLTIAFLDEKIKVKQRDKTIHFQSTKDVYDWLSLREEKH